MRAVTAPPPSPPPLVSVVIPVHDGEAHLAESLDSILAQTYRPLEILALDDCSTDSTPAILASYADRVTVVRQPRNLGQFPNVNDGLSRAHGDVVMVHHADDVARPHLVARAVAVLERWPEVVAVFSKDVFIDAAGCERGRFEYPAEIAGGGLVGFDEVLDILLRRKNALLRGGSCVVVRKRATNSAGPYREDGEIANDLDMWLRLARQGPFYLVDEHLWSYRSGHGSSSDRYMRLRTEPESFFRIVDRELSGGGRAAARPAALRAYEAHRAEDLVRVAAARYVRGEPDVAGPLRDVGIRSLLAADPLRRVPHLVALVGLRVLSRMPRSRPVSAAFERRLVSGTRR